jgi:hypothetical protein
MLFGEGGAFPPMGNHGHEPRSSSLARRRLDLNLGLFEVVELPSHLLRFVGPQAGVELQGDEGKDTRLGSRVSDQ